MRAIIPDRQQGGKHNHYNADAKHPLAHSAPGFESLSGAICPPRSDSINYTAASGGQFKSILNLLAPEETDIEDCIDRLEEVQAPVMTSYSLGLDAAARVFFREPPQGLGVKQNALR